MPRQALSPVWSASPFTGLFADSGPVPRRAADPAVCAWAGTLPHRGGGPAPLAVGGAAWDPVGAEAAGVGEAVERYSCKPEPGDMFVDATAQGWLLPEPFVAPEKWVLFHPDQYALSGFPFRPFGPSSACRWYPVRNWRDGERVWVPDWLLFLDGIEGHPYGPGLSTGLAAGRGGDPVVLRGLQEVIERDALVGAWWARYPLEEHDPERVLALLPPNLPPRLRRPNLTYRCYRVASPYSAHVTVVSLEGEDREGWVFSVGSACRERRAASWEKAFLEAVQGRHYVRDLLTLGPGGPGAPADFGGHALYYTLHPGELGRTVFQSPRPATPEGEAEEEGLEQLAARLGTGRPVLFRLLTPRALAVARVGWVVARVLVPGLQPLHGHHGLPFLGGPLWAPRGLADWRQVPPHPFP